jgi:glycosyltransferase involved in cell wall biosynthesis
MTRSQNLVLRLPLRLRRFLVALRNAFRELISPPMAMAEICRGNPAESDPRSGLPTWLITEWKEIHEVEPEIFPDESLIDSIQSYNIPNSRLGKPYLDLCARFGSNVTHVFLVPFMLRSGADVVTLNYIKAVIEHNLADHVVVLSTLGLVSPWARKLPSEARFIEFGRSYGYLSSIEQETLLSRLLLQMAPQVIHNINSELGYKIFAKYGGALCQISHLFATAFLGDITEEGRLVGYPFTYLPKCFDFLTAVFADNQTFIGKLVNLYGFEREKLHVHYTPVQAHNRIPLRVYGRKPLDILWAGRIDRQKRPDILTSIAQKCSSFHFHIYGEAVLDRDFYTDELRKLKNVRCYGAFDGFDSLPIHKYDLFLMTSQYEGIPTTLLESMSRGLPVVAPKVGGIHELIIPDRTGFLIDPFDDVDQYVRCLERIDHDPTTIPSLVEGAVQLIAARHSWQAFVNGLEKASGYSVRKNSASVMGLKSREV